MKDLVTKQCLIVHNVMDLNKHGQEPPHYFDTSYLTSVKVSPNAAGVKTPFVKSNDSLDYGWGHSSIPTIEELISTT